MAKTRLPKTKMTRKKQEKRMGTMERTSTRRMAKIHLCSPYSLPLIWVTVDHSLASASLANAD
jgi:hypothetical protein